MRQKFYWLEFGRGCAALGVLLSHVHQFLVWTPDYLSFVYPWGRWGVSFFFVLSGFVIHHVHGADIDSPHRAKLFAWRRFVRIFPTYWTVLLFGILAGKLVGIPAVHPTPQFLVENALLMPRHELYINVAWTLRHELFFYGLFLVAILNARIALGIGIGWIAAIVLTLPRVGFNYFFEGPEWYFVVSYLNLYFLAGVTISALGRRGKLGLVMAVFAVLLGVALPVQFYMQDGYSDCLAQLSAFGLIVALAVHLSLRGVPAPPLSEQFGALSYPLYLIHIPIMYIIRGALRHFDLPSEIYPEIAAAVLFSFIAAYLLSRMEKPLLARLKAFTFLSPQRAESQPSGNHSPATFGMFSPRWPATGSADIHTS